MRECLFSGGDPLLYPHLVRLVRAASDTGAFVYLNSVAPAIRPEQVTNLLGNGLQAWNFSLDSVDQRVNDYLRGVDGAFRQTTDAIAVVHNAVLGSEAPRRCYVNVMTVITRHNFRGLPDLLDWALVNEITAIYMMNVYGDLQGRFLLNAEEIREFRGDVVPKMLHVIAQHAGHNSIVANNAETVLTSFFSHDNPIENYALGIYWESGADAKNACGVPNYSLHLQPNGDVLPCCMPEISEDAEVGSLLTSSLSDVWNGEMIGSFRDHRIPFCLRCPVPRNRTLGLIPEMCRQFP